MQCAKAQGKHTGRPPLPEAKRKAIVELLGLGSLSRRAIGRKWALSRYRAALGKGVKGRAGRAFMSQSNRALRVLCKARALGQGSGVPFFNHRFRKQLLGLKAPARSNTLALHGN